MDTPQTNETMPPGGVIMTPEPQEAVQEPQAPPAPATLEQETVVVPPAGGAGTNPFIPSINGAQGAPPSEAAKTPPSGRSRILKVVVFIVLLLALGFAGRLVWGFIAGAKEVTITYWGLWENDATVRAVISDFEAQNPKIKVTYLKQSPKQYRERLQAAIQRGEGPDVFRFHNTWVPMLARELEPVPLEIMSVSDFTQAFYPVASADLTAGSTIYGIPLMIDGLGLYYNEDLFASAGVVPPTTWVEVLDLVPKLTVKNDTTILTSAIALGTTGNVEHFSDILATMFMQNGATLTNLQGKEAEETLIFYKNFSDPGNPYYTWNETLDNSVYAFAIGRTAMMVAPSWRAFDVAQISPDLRFKIVPIPQLPGNNVSWASYWVEGVSAQSENKDQAWTFLTYLTSRETATKLYTEAAKTRLFGEPYARVDMGSSISADPYAGAYVTQAPSAKSFPLSSRTFDNGLNDRMIKYLEDAVNGLGLGTSPTGALETLSSGFQQVLTSYGLTTAQP